MTFCFTFLYVIRCLNDTWARPCIDREVTVHPRPVYGLEMVYYFRLFLAIRLRRCAATAAFAWGSTSAGRASSSTMMWDAVATTVVSVHCADSRCWWDIEVKCWLCVGWQGAVPLQRLRHLQVCQPFLYCRIWITILLGTSEYCRIWITILLGTSEYCRVWITILIGISETIILV